LPDKVETLRSSLATRDFANLRLCGHSIKGAAATVSAERLRQCGEQLQKLAEAGDAEACAPLIEEVSVQQDLLRQALELRGWVEAQKPEKMQ